ncbi:patatin-like phospholipase domain-containing protein 4 isoform X3 [Rhinolophus sinicus]|uniref:patatin-like phospholipase domain-containing protein 4 isoform X3 n=1 Tax=Rhinolophus sinicus TaxID=89399 RepID=UPI003D7A5F94
MVSGLAAGMKHINLSFAACGFLGIYHLGAAAALCKHGQKLLKEVKAFAGASAGSLAASVLLTAPEKIEECNAFTYMFAEEIRRQSFGAVTPGYDFMARLRSGMESILPPNAHELAHHRLHVSITNTQTRENYLVCSFSSREDLIQVLLASSFVPVYAGLKPVEYNGQEFSRVRRVPFLGGCWCWVLNIHGQNLPGPPSRVMCVEDAFGVPEGHGHSDQLMERGPREVGGRRPHQQPSHPACRPDSHHLPLQWTAGHLPAGQRAAGTVCQGRQSTHNVFLDEERRCNGLSEFLHSPVTEERDSGHKSLNLTLTLSLSASPKSHNLLNQNVFVYQMNIGLILKLL